MAKTGNERQKEYRERQRLLKEGNVKFETYKPPVVFIMLRNAIKSKQRYFHKYDEKIRVALEDLLKELDKYGG